jgi:hypothetical protein
VSDAVKAVRHLLANNATLIATVPAARIMAGVLPQGTALPALAVTHVSTVPRNPVASPATLYFTSRVQVTVFAASYVSQQAVAALVRAALPRSRGSVNGVAVDSIILDSIGPDFNNDEAMCIGSLDFSVTYTAT